MQTDGSRRLTRREALAAGLATAGVLALDPRRGDAAPRGPYGPFKMGLQSYSLRGYTHAGKPDVTKALAVTHDLGLHYWEAYPAHLPMVDNPEQIVKGREQCKSAGVAVIGYGVLSFGRDHAANKKCFQFARAMGLGYLSADPDPSLECFKSLDALVEEYGVAIGIHPHGPGSRWAKIDDIAEAIRDHHPKIGCCVDTGHLLRSKEDPVRAVEVFGKRVYGVHLKDVKDAQTFTILGQGDLKLAELLKALVKNDYDYCLALEYEEKPEDPADDLRACLKAVRAAVATL